MDSYCHALANYGWLIIAYAERDGDKIHKDISNRLN